MREANEGLFSFGNNYEVEGTIAAVTDSSITIQREKLPPAALQVKQATKVELDGEQVSLSQLSRGQKVSAHFNLDGDAPLAIAIEADSKTERTARVDDPAATGIATPGLAPAPAGIAPAPAETTGTGAVPEER